MTQKIWSTQINHSPARQIPRYLQASNESIDDVKLRAYKFNKFTLKRASGKDIGAPAENIKMLGLIAYNFLSFLLGPYFLYRKLKRYRTKKHDYEFDFRRMTIPVYNKPAPGSYHIVFVGTGLAEYFMIEQLTLEIRKQYPDVAITWSMAVDTTLDAARKKHPSQSICHKPFDNLVSVFRWIYKVKPDMIVSIVDIWPGNIIGIARLCRIKTMVINVRQKEDFPSNGLWDRSWLLIRKWILGQYDSVCVQDEATARTFSSLNPAAKNISVSGPIYLTQDKSSVRETKEVENWILSSKKEKLPILALGSSNKEKDETFVLDAFDIVRAQSPCTLLLAPRNLNRVDEVLSLIKKRGLTVSQRSHYSKTVNNAECSKIGKVDVLLLDTLGELFTAYSFTESVFIGGTLSGIGHNVIEPVVWGKPVVFGPGHGEMTPAQALCVSAGVGRVVHSSSELAEFWLQILSNTTDRENISSQCQYVVQQQHESIRNNIAAIMQCSNYS